MESPPQRASNATNYVFERLIILKKVAQNFRTFTSSDFATFVVPNTIFGTCCALAGLPLVAGDNLSTQEGIWRSPQLYFSTIQSTSLRPGQSTFMGVFGGGLAQQAMETHAARIDETYRSPSGPVITYSGRLSYESLLIEYRIRDGLYSDGNLGMLPLKASDDNWIQRNFVAALAFAVYNWRSLKVATGGGGSSLTTAEMVNAGFIWIVMFSRIIMTTMHIQDLKDMLGDKARGRVTAPLYLGERVTRWTLAVPIALWNIICGFYWQWNSCLPAMSLGLYIVWHCLKHHGKEEDRSTGNCGVVG